METRDKYEETHKEVAELVSELTNLSDDLFDDLKVLADNVEYLSDFRRRELAEALRKLEERALGYAEKFKKNHALED
jgi:uncharacterized coiled-coil DUF342 family protein